MKLTVAVFYVKLHMESSMQNNCRKIKTATEHKSIRNNIYKAGSFLIATVKKRAPFFVFSERIKRLILRVLLAFKTRGDIGNTPASFCHDDG